MPGLKNLWPIPALGIGFSEIKITECYNFTELWNTLRIDLQYRFIWYYTYMRTPEILKVS